MWITNVAKIAEALKKADRAYDATRQAAEHLPLVEKVKVYREARATQQAAYAAVHALEI